MYVMFLVGPIRHLRKIAGRNWVNETPVSVLLLAVGLEASLLVYMVSSFFASVAFLWYAYYLAYAVCVRSLYMTTTAEALENGTNREIRREFKL
jgi:hypothetical protein